MSRSPPFDPVSPSDFRVQADNRRAGGLTLLGSIENRGNCWATAGCLRAPLQRTRRSAEGVRTPRTLRVASVCPKTTHRRDAADTIFEPAWTMALSLAYSGAAPRGASTHDKQSQRYGSAGGSYVPHCSPCTRLLLRRSHLRRFGSGSLSTGARARHRTARHRARVASRSRTARNPHREDELRGLRSSRPCGVGHSERDPAFAE